MINSVLINKILDSNEWPAVQLPENLELLNEIADKYFLESEFDSLLAAMLIYHQIIESLCMHLLKCCHFFIQLSIFPVEIHIKVPKEKMLGFYVSELEKSIEFAYKQEFIDYVHKYNALRNRTVHQMKKKYIHDITSELRQVKVLFDRIFALYDKIQDSFKVIYHDYKKNVFIDEDSHESAITHEDNSIH